jgi:hypothetical protein
MQKDDIEQLLADRRETKRRAACYDLWERSSDNYIAIRKRSIGSGMTLCCFEPGDSPRRFWSKSGRWVRGFNDTCLYDTFTDAVAALPAAIDSPKQGEQTDGL